jgi:hypothetical protein
MKNSLRIIDETQDERRAFDTIEDSVHAEGVEAFRPYFSKPCEGLELPANTSLQSNAATYFFDLMFRRLLLAFL